MAAKNFLTDVLTGMGFGMACTIEEDNDGHISINLNSGVYHQALVANDMQVLDALEHLVDKIVNVEPGDRYKLKLDSENIRTKADDELRTAALDMAERAKEQGKVCKMGPLDPRSRRIIHLVLKEVEGVRTESTGDGVFRRVCIIPDGIQ